MLSFGLYIKLIGFLLIIEQLYGFFSRCNILFPCRKKGKTATCNEPTTYTFVKKMRRQVEVAYFFLLIWLLEELVLLLTQSLSISLHLCLKMCIFEVSRLE